MPLSFADNVHTTSFICFLFIIVSTLLNQLNETKQQGTKRSIDSRPFLQFLKKNSKKPESVAY